MELSPESLRTLMDRPLTSDESGLINWLLTNSEDNATDFLPQVSEIRVHGKCSCGCPTIDLTGAQTIAAGYDGLSLVADVVGEVSGADVGILLFQEGGCLTCLEIYASGNNPPKFPLPQTSALRRWGQMTQPIRAEIKPSRTLLESCAVRLSFYDLIGRGAYW